MPLTLVAERREPSGETLKNKAETVGLAPLRYNADSKVITIGSNIVFKHRADPALSRFLDLEAARVLRREQNDLRNPTPACSI